MCFEYVAWVGLSTYSTISKTNKNPWDAVHSLHYASYRAGFITNFILFPYRFLARKSASKTCEICFSFVKPSLFKVVMEIGCRELFLAVSVNATCDTCIVLPWWKTCFPLSDVEKMRFFQSKKICSETGFVLHAIERIDVYGFIWQGSAKGLPFVFLHNTTRDGSLWIHWIRDKNSAIVRLRASRTWYVEIYWRTDKPKCWREQMWQS